LITAVDYWVNGFSVSGLVIMNLHVTGVGYHHR